MKKKLLVLAASVIAKRDGVAPRPDTRTASAFPTRLGTVRGNGLIVPAHAYLECRDQSPCVLVVGDRC
jgi:hypothetical protein